MQRTESPHPQRGHWKWSLATRLAAVWALLLGAAVGISSWIAHRDAREQLLGTLCQGIERDSRVIQLRMETWMRALREDARSCSQSPLLFEFLSHLGAADEPRWRQLLEDEFRAVFAGKPAYFQMRLLSANGTGDGREILRLDRSGGQLEVTPQERLQSKADRAYYRETLELPAGAIYFSQINLNRDFGEITRPYIPTIRAAVTVGPLRGGRGRAMLVINADLRPLFDELRTLGGGSELRLFDFKDDYLLHPDGAAVFASDLGHGVRPSASHAELLAEVPGQPTWLGRGEGRGGLALGTKVTFGGVPAREAMLVVSLPERAWRPELEEWRRRGIRATLLAVLAGAGLAVLVSLPFTRRLRHLAIALRQFDASEHPETLPDGGKDEVGIAVERFREMSIKVREQVESLQAARDDAEAANAAKESFLAVMSHEIRTPMNAVVGLVRALEANHPPPHQKPILTSLRASLSNLMTLLNTALDYTRLREGAIHYRRERFDAAALTREIGQSFRPSALAKQLDLRIEAPRTLWVEGDPVRLRQVLNNLVSNAVKFTGRGGVSITLGHRDGWLACAVADTGPGIPPEQHAHVFTPFATLETASPQTETGAGLGLAVSSQLVEQQGGVIDIDSAAGRGATFTVRLPYAEVEGAAVEGSGSAAKERESAACRGLRVLYVEDVASNRQVMALTLASTGCELACADSGAEALRLLGKETVDVVLVDLQLPDQSGDDLARAILLQHPDLPVIAVTAQSGAAARERCLAAGMRAVVLKPYTAEELIHCLATHAGAGETIVASVIDGIHPDDPAAARALAASMADEFHAAARELEGLVPVEAVGWQTAVASVQRLRHRLKTATVRFQLHDLDDVLQALEQAPVPDAAALRRAVILLGQAATSCRNAAFHSGSPQPGTPELGAMVEGAQ